MAAGANGRSENRINGFRSGDILRGFDPVIRVPVDLREELRADLKEPGEALHALIRNEGNAFGISERVSEDGGPGAEPAFGRQLVEDAPGLPFIPFVREFRKDLEDDFFDEVFRVGVGGEVKEIGTAGVFGPDGPAAVSHAGIHQGREIRFGVVFEEAESGAALAALDGLFEFLNRQRRVAYGVSPS